MRRRIVASLSVPRRRSRCSYSSGEDAAQKDRHRVRILRDDPTGPLHVDLQERPGPRTGGPIKLRP